MNKHIIHNYEDPARILPAYPDIARGSAQTAVQHCCVTLVIRIADSMDSEVTQKKEDICKTYL